ncbi:MAG: hypothetical protein HRT87_06950 [Legionellales bacterium]|nr:hypothetical protein [Legionellales bacterium]
MSKKAYYIVDNHKLDSLRDSTIGLSDTNSVTTFGIVTSNSKPELGPIYGFVASSYGSNAKDKINALLGTTTTDLTNVKRIFVLPGCNATMLQIRNVAKQNNLMITHQLSKADVIIGNKSSLITRNFRNLSTKSNAVGIISNNNGVMYYRKTGNNDIDYYKHPVLCTSNISSHFQFSYYTTDRANSSANVLLSGLLVDILYELRNLSTSKLKGVIHEDDFLRMSSSIVPLTEELADTIVSMVNSSNKDDLDLAGNLIVNLDPYKNPHLIHKMLNSAYSFMWKFNRNKAVKNWFKSLGYDYTDNKVHRLVESLHEAGALTHEAFMYFEPIARKQIRLYDRELYDVTFSVKPEYKKYLKKKEDETK